MRLRNRNETPVGGFTYNDPITGRFFSTDSTLKSLVDKVRNYQVANGFKVPDDLDLLIEDYICTYQPKGRCWYKGIGDQISRVIHTAAGAIDKVAGTKLERRARGCGGCGKRRNQLNKLSLPRK